MTQTVELRRIGRSDLMTSRVGLGCVTFGREIDEQTSFRILDYAVERGIVFFDTAEFYGGGNAKKERLANYGTSDEREVSAEMYSSEKILGRWLAQRGCQDRVVICTKVSSGASADNIRKRVVESLERLNVDCIDVYKIHVPDDRVPIGESLQALNEQVVAGNIRVIGTSNFSAAQMQEALEACRSKGCARFEITQPPYSLGDRSYEPDLLPLCHREQIAVTTYSPLAAGFLAGKYSPTQERQNFPAGSRFDVSPGHADVYFSDRNFRVVEHLRAKANELGIPMVRLAMAWAMANPMVTAVLVGARTTGHIDNALEAMAMGIDANLRAEMSSWD